MGNRDGRTATLIVLVSSSALLIVPIYLVGGLVDGLSRFRAPWRRSRTAISMFHRRPDSVATWPVMGRSCTVAWLAGRQR